MDEEVKRLMRMHKLELLGLLQEVTEENDRLRANCRQLEEANAKLALSNHELNMECDALHGELTALRQGGVQEDAGRQPYAPSESAYGLPQPETTEERALPADAHTLPLETLPRPWWRRSRLLPGPRRRRMHIWRAARRRRRRPMPRQRKSWPRPGSRRNPCWNRPAPEKAAMERETREVSGRLRGEMQRLNKFMSAMETAEKTEENP